MTDPKGPSWSFGGAGTGGNSGGSLFSQPASNTSKPGSTLFGSGSNPPTTSATSFGNTTSASGSSLFGSTSGAGQTPTFGSSGSSNPFGGKNTQAARLFGQAASQSNPSASTAAPSTGFPNFSTPNKPAESPAPSQTPTANMFGGGTGQGNTGGFFSGIGSKASSSADQANTTTPTSKPTTSLFGNSTTPAGPPPNAGTGATGSSLFGKPASGSNSLFAPKTDSSMQGANSMAPPATTTSFTNFSFQSSKPPESAQTISSTQPANMQGSTSNSGSSDIFGKRPAQPEGGLFQNLNKAHDTGASKSTVPQQPRNEASKTPNLFNIGKQTSASNSTPVSQTASAPSLLFPQTTQSQTSATNSANAPSTAHGGFSLFNKPVSSATPTASTSAPSLFSNPGKPQDKAAATSAEATATTASSSEAPAPAPSLFGNLTKSTTTSTTPQAPSTSGAAPSTGATNANLGASTAGPAPPAQSRLKNKSMDDIITRWASDLSKYQKEFQQQAEKVATWDRMLVENSEKIQKLYGSTLEAERATTEVERQLTAVENDQAELAHWLDYYEREVDSMISSTIGQDGTLSGPDQERERTYQLASRLSERLDEMGKDLSGIIEEINDASSTLSKNNNADDPLSQVVRVLNNHLTQLQQIDQGAAALQLKVQQAQRAGSMLGPSNGLNGPNSDAADGFYRSFMGRR